MNELSRHRVNTERIASSWDDMLRVAGSLQMGTVSASEIIRSLLQSDKPSTLARALFQGHRGEIRQRYREGQEDQLTALGLVVNVVALGNTTYMDSVLEHLRRENSDVWPEDAARLSPLEHRHVTFLGQYSFSLAEPVAKGKLRPLRDPAEDFGSPP